MTGTELSTTSAIDVARGEVHQEVIENRAEVGTLVGLTVMGSQSRTLQLRHDVEEVVYFVEGELEVTIDATVQHAQAGQFVTIPRESWHSFRNDSDRRAQMIFVFANQSPRTDTR